MIQQQGVEEYRSTYQHDKIILKQDRAGVCNPQEHTVQSLDGMSYITYNNILICF